MKQKTKYKQIKISILNVGQGLKINDTMLENITMIKK